MSESSSKPPKPFSTVSYLFFTTLWAFLLPGLVTHGLPALLVALSGIINGFRDTSDMSLLAVGIGLLVSVVLFSWWFLKFQKRLSANLRTGQIPGSFTLLILPFWLPLYWGLAVIVICFFIAPISFFLYQESLIFAFPQYLLAFVFTAISSGNMEFFLAASCIVTLLVSIVGTVYIVRLAPPISKLRGLTLCTVITLFLCGLVGMSYSHFRAAILPPSWNSDEIVQDEQNRNLRWRSDTDLSEYIPFSDNNKLVKIESPTLCIESEHPKIHGAFALYPVYAAAVEATYRNTEEIIFNPHYFTNSTVMSGTSPEAFNSLLNSTSDMIFMLQPSEKQLQEAKEKGIELVITPIGYEAFVFFVSRVNPVDGLSLDQIRDIYSKKTTRWNEVGGKNERILPFQRPEGSGSQTAMLRVMGNVSMTPPQKEEFRFGMGAIVADVADYRNYGNAIGFSFRYYVEGLFKHDGVKLLKIGGIAPAIENVQNRSYPLISELVIISRKDNTNPNVSKLTEWFLSPQGQELIQNVGYVPME